MTKNMAQNENNATRNIMTVPFCRTSKQNICFRECVKLIKIAEETGCMIKLTAGQQSGSTESMLSLLKLAIVPGTPLVLSLQGSNMEQAYHKCMDVLNGEAA